jgi:dephospho-CoA kinase
MLDLFGLTGGIGSGKSTVAGLFRTLGIPVFDSDSRAKILMDTDPRVRSKILELFGPEAYLQDQQLHRKWIASRVFDNLTLLQQLNQIVHPAVYEDLIRWMKEDNQVKAPYLIQESAIIFEENLLSRMKGVILVVAAEEIRMERVMKRDNMTKEQVLERMQHQWPDSRKIPLSDFVIYNDGDRSLIDQARDIHQMILGKV